MTRSEQTEGVVDKTIRLYHGSREIVEVPEFGKGKVHNDFGQGFYCTENIDLAKEWAVSSTRSGFANRYRLNTECLRILRLNGPGFTILNWIAVLVRNRVFSIRAPIARRARTYLMDNFDVDVNACDVIVGYRADDSYFDYAESFLNNTLSVEQLSIAMNLGKLGEQVVLKSEHAFSKLEFEGFEVAEKEIYYTRRKARDDKANAAWLDMADSTDNGLYIQDIIRGGIGNDDARIPKNIS